MSKSSTPSHPQRWTSIQTDPIPEGAVRWRTGDGHVFVVYPGQPEYMKSQMLADEVYHDGMWHPKDPAQDLSACQ